VTSFANTLSVAGFWAAVGIMGYGSAMVVRATYRNRNEPAFDGLIVLACIPLVATFVVAMPTLFLGGTASFHTLAGKFLDSAAMQGGAVGAVLAWVWALASVLLSLVAGLLRHRAIPRLGE
jgi:hypothetical protein